MKIKKMNNILIDKIAKNGNNGTTKVFSGGNTKPREIPSKYWCFTYNHYNSETLETIISDFKKKDCLFIIGEEIGNESKIPHLQGYVESNIKIRPIEYFGFPKEIHWEKRKGTKDQNIKYCSKDNKIHTNFKDQDLLKSKPLKLITEDNLYSWQRDIFNLCKTEPDERSIYWFWEEIGNKGKTTLCKFLSYHLGAIPLEGKKNDILYCAAEFNSKIYIWDLERSMEEYVSYGALEKIKNGYFMCSKYESKPIIRNNPHVIVFANFLPKTESLSADRWKIFNLKKGKIDLH